MTALIWSGMLAHSTKQTRRVNAFGGERGRFGAHRGAVGERNQKGCGGQAGRTDMGTRWGTVTTKSPFHWIFSYISALNPIYQSIPLSAFHPMYPLPKKSSTMPGKMPKVKNHFQ
jgi:hypothetical protein